jgi:hypothetical protein
LKGFTILIQFGWCGFGIAGGLIPEIRLGLIRLAWCRGWIFDGFDRCRAALKAAVEGMGA